MSVRKLVAAAMITGTAVIGLGAPAFARNGADDPAGHVRQEHRHGQVEVHHHRGGHR
jgi:hypothetical protein